MLRILPLIAAVMLSACSGSSTSSNAVVRAPTPIETIRINAERLKSEIDSDNITQADAIPVSTKISYSGIAGFGFLAESTNGDGVGGDMNIDVNFANNTVTGQIDNFYGRDGDAREGLLTLSNGQIARTSGRALLAAEVSGSLDIVSGVKDLNGVMLGGFTGDTPEHAAGSINLTHSLQPSGNSPVVPVKIEGGFLLEAK